MGELVNSRAGRPRCAKPARCTWESSQGEDTLGHYFTPVENDLLTLLSGVKLFYTTCLSTNIMVLSQEP